jgi:hypothetical protein
MKTKKVDGKLRVGGETKIPHGARGGGVGTHKMSKGVRHIGHVPSDAGQFDQPQPNESEPGNDRGVSQE